MPIDPFAPPLFSTSTVWPQISPSFCATIRPMMSEAPPGGYVTITWNCFDGAVCAEVSGTQATERNALATTALCNENFATLMLSSPSLVFKRGMIIASQTHDGDHVARFFCAYAKQPREITKPQRDTRV